ncbi:MAG: hypothetical protein GF414_08520 [Candidatus Altiarchaeales archaeon]|nr:hypothetical protein [Candidatus Altiarchaeales archaeon]
MKKGVIYNKKPAHQICAELQNRIDVLIKLLETENKALKEKVRYLEKKVQVQAASIRGYVKRQDKIRDIVCPSGEEEEKR